MPQPTLAAKPREALVVYDDGDERMANIMCASLRAETRLPASRRNSRYHHNPALYRLVIYLQGEVLPKYDHAFVFRYRYFSEVCAPEDHDDALERAYYERMAENFVREIVQII